MTFFRRGSKCVSGLVVVALVSGHAAGAAAQTAGTAFTFQGRLTDAGTPSDGPFDFRFILYDAPVGGSQVGPVVLQDDVVVVAGLFTVPLDFGPGHFAGSARFLEIAVRPGASTGAYTLFGTRQELKPAPQSVFSQAAPWTGVTGKPAGFADNVDNDLLGSSVCALNHVMKWNGAAWACAPDVDTNTTYTATSGIQLAGTTFSPVYGGDGTLPFIARSDHTHFGQSWTGSTATALWITNTGTAVIGQSSGNVAAILGWSTATSGSNAHGVRAESSSSTGNGVLGISNATSGAPAGVRGQAISNDGTGVFGSATATQGANYGVRGSSPSGLGIGVLGESTATGGAGRGVVGTTQSLGLGVGVAGYAAGTSGQTYGVYGESASTQGIGVVGWQTSSTGGIGIQGRSNVGGIAVEGIAPGTGVHGVTTGSAGGGARGVWAHASSTVGSPTALYAEHVAPSGSAVLGASYGTGNNVGVYGVSSGSAGGVGVLGQVITNAAGATTVGIRGIQGPAPTAYAGYFDGRVQVTTTLSKGAGSFKIDHPLDPENKYLYHSFVESPDMMNVYNGNVVTDGEGFAVVELPEWFEALNRDFRYQLTVVDGADERGFVQVKVARKIAGNRFAVRTSAPRIEVSWQVTGIRKDPFAERNRIPVEEAKPEGERGTYLHPEAWGVPSSKGLDERARPRLDDLKSPRDADPTSGS